MFKSSIETDALSMVMIMQYMIVPFCLFGLCHVISVVNVLVILLISLMFMCVGYISYLDVHRSQVLHLRVTQCN